MSYNCIVIQHTPCIFFTVESHGDGASTSQPKYAQSQMSNTHIFYDVLAKGWLLEHVQTEHIQCTKGQEFEHPMGRTINEFIDKWKQITLNTV